MTDDQKPQPLRFHPNAFRLVFDMPQLSPSEHVAAFRRMLREWEREKAEMAKENATSPQAGDTA